MTALTIEYEPSGRDGRVYLTIKLGEETIHTDKVDVRSATSRQRFVNRLTKAFPALKDRSDEIERELLAVVNRLDAEKKQVPESDGRELDLSCIVRPELFHAHDVSGLLVPVTSASNAGPSARWILYLRWADGKRERRELVDSIELSNGRRLWVHPEPADPVPTTRSGWTRQGRTAWLEGVNAPNPAEVFKRICELFAYFLDFPGETGPGDTATLALWTMLTYAFPVWSAVPYLSIGGPAHSGKTRVFEVLSRLVFRPVQSSDMTAACLFRTLHEHGGVLLLDEAERLRDGTPAAGELRSILLSGYKKGSPARRLEPTGDGKFVQRSFDVFGPKAIACIANLPEALTSRCIRLIMFRAGPGSPKPRRRIDADPEIWAVIRDDLHTLTLEYGQTFRQLAERTDVCPMMSGRDFELWQPLLAMAAWIDKAGAEDLLVTMQQHTGTIINANRDDSTPHEEEILLRILAAEVRGGREVTCSELLDLAKREDDATFKKYWNAQRVSSRLRRYKIRTRKSGSRRPIEASEPELLRVQENYGIDLGFSVVPTVPTVPEPVVK